MIYTFELYEYGRFVGYREVEADSELLATVDLCSRLEDEGQAHLEYEILEDDDPFAGLRCEYCNGAIEEGHDCLYRGWDYS